MEKEVLLALENRCTYEEPPVCQSFCPLHVDARAIVQRLLEGKPAEARKLLDRQMPLAQLTGWLCEGACKERCLRRDLGSSVNMPLLERYVIQNSKSVKPFPMPASTNKIAAIGSSLGSMILASEMSRKGHKVTFYLTGPQGGSLLKVKELPETVLTEAWDLLSSLGNSFETAPAQSPEFLAELLDNYRAVMVDQGDPSVNTQALGLTDEDLATDPLTKESPRANIFLAPPESVAWPFLEAMAAGKGAAISLDRIFQGVKPNLAREKELPFATTLVVDTAQVTPQEPLTPANPWEPSAEEIKAEAERCLQCSCQACLNVCPHLRHFKGYPKKYAREMYNNIITAYGIRSSNIIITSCLECDLCKEVCPHGADVGSFIRLARKEMIDTNHMPAAAHEYALEDLVSANAPDTSFFRPPPGQTQAERIFFPGCQLVASRPETLLKTYEHLNKALGGVGLFSSCCGAPARWSGRGQLTGQIASAIQKVWRENAEPTFILACPSCQLFFAAELPEIKVVSLWDVLSQLPPPAKVSPLALTLRDPCAARYDENLQKNARRLLTVFAPNFKEPHFSGRLAKCCGYGGLGGHVNPPLALEFTQDAIAESQGPLVAYCVMCRDRYRQAGAPSLHLLDILFETNLNDIMERPGPNLTQRRDNRLLFRRLALNAFWREEEPMPSPCPYEIVIPEELWAKMEKRRILRRDVEAVIESAAQTGPLFFNQDTGHSLTNLRPRQVTFWVEYEQDPAGRYLIHDVWCHRMVVPGSSGEGAESPATLEGYARTGGRV
ncbi:MAG: 4Fe-4S dicluster domain-containing protein [Deltaproteobacteria bacterium]|jgi:Fe-S oxidoreductase|nr:4Fe-4S dicluster domain-containing protein [Deltaproteobacteria bacterium]